MRNRHCQTDAPVRLANFPLAARRLCELVPDTNHTSYIRFSAVQNARAEAVSSTGPDEAAARLSRRAFRPSAKISAQRQTEGCPRMRTRYPDEQRWEIERRLLSHLDRLRSDEWTAMDAIQHYWESYPKGYRPKRIVILGFDQSSGHAPGTTMAVAGRWFRRLVSIHYRKLKNTSLPSHRSVIPRPSQSHEY